MQSMAFRHPPIPRPTPRPAPTTNTHDQHPRPTPRPTPRPAPQPAPPTSTTTSTTTSTPFHRCARPCMLRSEEISIPPRAKPTRSMGATGHPGCRRRQAGRPTCEALPASHRGSHAKRWTRPSPKATSKHPHIHPRDCPDGTRNNTHQTNTISIIGRGH
jgi:hypothetical protein